MNTILNTIRGNQRRPTCTLAEHSAHRSVMDKRIVNTVNRTAGTGDFSNRTLLKVEEVAMTLAVSRAVVYELLSEGKLKRIKIGKSTRIAMSDILAFIDAQAESAA